MSVFSKLSKKLAGKPVETEPKEQPAAAAEAAAPEPDPEPSASAERIFNEEGYDQFGYDRDGYRRDGYDRRGHRREITRPLDPSVPLIEDIEKYRRKDGHFEFEMALYANFADIKNSFEANREDTAEILYNLFMGSDKTAIAVWKWMLRTFDSTLSNPADAFRLGSGVLYVLEKRRVERERVLAILKENQDITEALFKKSAHIDARYAELLSTALLNKDNQFFETMMELLLQNQNLGTKDALPIDRLLKMVLDQIPQTEMTEDIYMEINKYIKRTKVLMRKALQQMLENNMTYFREEAARRKEQEERNRKLEAQRQKLAQELTAQQLEAGSRLTQRKLRSKFHELKAASLANRKANPTWEGGTFADFQQLEGLIVAAPGKQDIVDTLLPDDRVELFREPFNQQDTATISVKDVHGNKIGYISNRANTLLALLMDHGEKMFGRVFSVGREPDSDIIQVCIEIFSED